MYHSSRFSASLKFYSVNLLLIKKRLLQGYYTINCLLFGKM
eukprot:UN25020